MYLLLTFCTIFNKVNKKIKTNTKKELWISYWSLRTFAGLLKLLALVSVWGNVSCFEKILGHANRHWFAYPQPVFKTLCNDLALQFRGDFTSLYDLDINHFDLFQRRAHALSNKDKSVRCIPIDVLKIKSINSFKYKVELLCRNLDFDRDDPDSEPFKVAMCFMMYKFHLMRLNVSCGLIKKCVGCLTYTFLYKKGAQ